MRLVRTTIVDDDNFEIRERLSKDAIQATGQCGGCVIDGNHDAYLYHASAPCKTVVCLSRLIAVAFN